MLHKIDTPYLDHVHLRAKLYPFYFFATDNKPNVILIDTNHLIGWMLTGLILIALLSVNLLNNGPSFMIAGR